MLHRSQNVFANSIFYSVDVEGYVPMNMSPFAELMEKHIGKTHASKKYDQSSLNTNCFWRSTKWNITPAPVGQFHKILITIVGNEWILWSKNFVKSKSKKACIGSNNTPILNIFLHHFSNQCFMEMSSCRARSLGGVQRKYYGKCGEPKQSPRHYLYKK